MGETGKHHGICFSQHAGDKFQYEIVTMKKHCIFLMFFLQLRRKI